MLIRHLAFAVCICLPLVAAAQSGPNPTPGAAQPLRLESLVFEKGSGERHHAIRAWMQAHAQGWRHLPLRLGGNFLEERWCAPGVDERRCSARAKERGNAWMALETLTYDKDFPKVFGSLVSIGSFPQQGDLALRFDLAIDGGTIVGDGMNAEFLVMRGDDVIEGATLGAKASLVVATSTISVDAPGGWRAALNAMKASPQSLRQHAAAMLDALDRRVGEALARGEVMGFDEAPYRGGGIPPMRIPRPLKPEELARAKEVARQELARRREFFEKRAQALHAILVARVPVDLL